MFVPGIFSNFAIVEKYMQGDTFKTIDAVSEGLYKVKGSKFISFAHPVNDVEAVKQLLDTYKKIYYDARHVCYAYMIGPEGDAFRANDDGEPSGTAGRPILGQIQSFGLTDVLVVVIRYFGGILLGTGGLVVAYKSAASEALGSAVIIEKTVDVEYCIVFEFRFLNDVMRIIKTLDAQIISQDYEMECQVRLRIRKDNSTRLYIALEKVESLSFKDCI